MDKQVMEDLSRKVTLTACYKLAVILLSMVAVMLVGFFTEKVDNAKIFEIVGPAFQTIVGGFIGLITGIRMSRISAKV